MFEASLQGAVRVVRGTSALNVDSLEKFEETLSGLLRGGQPMTVLDMTGIPLVDSRGLEALLDMQVRFCRRGGDLKLSGLNPLCADILHVTRVDRHFSVFDKLIDAVGSFTK